MNAPTLLSPFAGLWDVTHATLPNGEFAYSGRINIQQSAATFQLDWDISAGHYVGIGLTHGDHLYVSCGEQFAGVGIALYTCRPDAAPTIQWSTAELAGVVGTGAFTSPWSGAFEGEHQLAQYLPNGQLYGEWSITIQKTGAIYELTWRKGGNIHFKGLGLDTPQGLAVGWYLDVSQLAFLDYHVNPQDARQLQATWALGSYTTLGNELLTRL